MAGMLANPRRSTRAGSGRLRRTCENRKRRPEPGGTPGPGRFARSSRRRRTAEENQLTRFYDIDDANDRLAELRPLLESLRADRDEVAEAQADLVRFRETNGTRHHADELKRREDVIREIVRRMQRSVARIEGWSVTLREIDGGLVDFPALVNGRPVWLCWRLGEDHVGFWHEQDTGFANRKPLIDLE